MKVGGTETRRWVLWSKESGIGNVDIARGGHTFVFLACFCGKHCSIGALRTLHCRAIFGLLTVYHAITEVKNLACPLPLSKTWMGWMKVGGRGDRIPSPLSLMPRGKSMFGSSTCPWPPASHTFEKRNSRYFSVMLFRYSIFALSYVYFD